MLVLVLAAALDAQSALFLSSCGKELTDECGAYLTGFVDATLAHNATADAVVLEGRKVLPRTACLPNPVDMERVRVAAVQAVRGKPRGEPFPGTMLYALSGLYPCGVSSGKE